jgi:hypothetical protein
VLIVKGIRFCGLNASIGKEIARAATKIAGKGKKMDFCFRRNDRIEQAGFLMEI